MLAWQDAGLVGESVLFIFFLMMAGFWIQQVHSSELKSGNLDSNLDSSA